MAQEKEAVLETIDAIKENVDLFYQQKQKKALQELDGVLAKIMGAVDVLFQYKAGHAELPLDEVKITESLKEAMEALQNKDYVLLADILQYDFVEYMEELTQDME